MSALDNKAMQALSDAGAQCGVCGDQPGDRTCPDCERCYRQYVAALRAAGWAPRAEVLTDFAARLTRKARQMGAEWLRVDQVCEALHRVAANPDRFEAAADAYRAEVLAEAAEAIVAENDRILWATTPGKHWAADLLRRMAEPAPEPQLPTCVLCGATGVTLRPTGGRYPSGAQKFACSAECTEVAS
ncbi:hypothetical protein [Streptomyces sp900116325]|uniref:hypothetical protein n=1 Tax=Streptomyces sp. 900116325 TaxID=3154295 RepID=UPI003317FFB2